MYGNDLILSLAEQRLDALRAEAPIERLARKARAARRRPERQIRRAIGRSIIRIGARIAAEPFPEPARSG